MTVSVMSLGLTCACAHGGVYQSVFTLKSPYLGTPTIFRTGHNDVMQFTLLK